MFFPAPSRLPPPVEIAFAPGQPHSWSMSDVSEISISVLGELTVRNGHGQVELPASRKARALLGFLATTDRPHRRERLCEMFWDLPDDPKAALRWALSKLRKVVDTPDRSRIIADRERVRFDGAGVTVDLRDLRHWLKTEPDMLSPGQLESASAALGEVVLDGLDGAGDDTFGSWLMTERQDVLADRVEVLRRDAAEVGERPAMCADSI